MAKKFKACSLDGCNGNAHWSAGGRKGFCCSHYKRWTRHGNPLAGRTSDGDALRFINEVAVPYQGTDCLTWPFAKIGNGYGAILINGNVFVASRQVCERAHGAPPSPRHDAAHSCGKGHEGCINPNHLSWKTRIGNMADTLVHGTHNRGERHYACKLTEPEVKEILSLKGMKTPRALANIFGVSKSTIYGIHSGRIWAWLSRGRE